MLASLTTLFVRVWEKALFLIALLACLTLCSLATHYFTAAPEEEDAVGHRPAAVSILPWQDRSYFSVSVPEATAANEELFGTDRMIDALNSCAEGRPEDILHGVRRAVDAFVGDAEQFDDLTMMCLEYLGPK